MSVKCRNMECESEGKGYRERGHRSCIPLELSFFPHAQIV